MEPSKTSHPLPPSSVKYITLFKTQKQELLCRIATALTVTSLDAVLDELFTAYRAYKNRTANITSLSYVQDLIRSIPIPDSERCEDQIRELLGNLLLDSESPMRDSHNVAYMTALDLISKYNLMYQDKGTFNVVEEIFADFFDALQSPTDAIFDQIHAQYESTKFDCYVDAPPESNDDEDDEIRLTAEEDSRRLHASIRNLYEITDELSQQLGDLTEKINKLTPDRDTYRHNRRDLDSDYQDHGHRHGRGHSAHSSPIGFGGDDF
jgi:hypothetical protein